MEQEASEPIAAEGFDHQQSSKTSLWALLRERLLL